MIRIIFILLFSFTYKISVSQNVLRLEKNIKLDTLRLWVNYPAEFDAEDEVRYDSILNSTVNRFNEQSSFIVKIDSTNKRKSIVLNMEPVKYVDTKRNILSTGLSLSLIGGHIFLLSAYGWTLPIYPILLPATVCKVNLQIHPDIITSRQQTKMWINPNGYLMSREKQSQKFEKHFDRKIYKFLKHLDKQN